MNAPLTNRFATAGTISFAALALAILLSGCGGGASSTGATAQTATGSAPATAVAGQTGGGGRTGAETSTPAHGTPARSAKTGAPAAPAPGASTQAAPAPAPRAATPPRERVLRRFAGSGDTRLGTIIASSPQVLVWYAQRPPIQIFTANGFLLVNSGTPNGSIHLSRGTYRSVRVATHASWSVELRAPAA